jgi:hypothetical protein
LKLSQKSDDKMELMRWLGRAHALVSEVSMLDAAEISAAMTVRLAKDPWAVHETANAVLFRALATAERKAPVSSHGSFIQAGNPLDVMTAVGKVLAGAKARVRIVDPYMDDKALTDFAVLARDGVIVELLSDAATAKPSFVPAVQRYNKQFGATRPLQARLSVPKSLHDRLFVLDESTVYTLTQSLNALAARSPASIVRMDGDAVGLKIAAYDAYWSTATAVV